MGTRLPRRFRSPVLTTIAALVMATGVWAVPAQAAPPRNRASHCASSTCRCR
ncbi:hypothetical protein M2302_002457 [Micromonospora sp. A200]|nr:hypothetical protein [Micromonospora sp. A200]